MISPLLEREMYFDLSGHFLREYSASEVYEKLRGSIGDAVEYYTVVKPDPAPKARRMEQAPEDRRMSELETMWWPTTFEERNLAGDVRIQPEDIADYAYPPGDRKRYTTEGWWKAIDLGIAQVTVQDMFAELTRLRAIEAAAREVQEQMPGMPVFVNGKHNGDWRYAFADQWPDFAKALDELRKALGEK